MTDFKISEEEELLLKSWDAPVSAAERSHLATLIQQDTSLRNASEQYRKIRDIFKRNEPDSFGPFFAERILHVLKQHTENIEYQVFFFFKKYQLLVTGVAVALLLVNMLLTDRLSLPSIFGLEKEVEDVYEIDLYEMLNP